MQEIVRVPGMKAIGPYSQAVLANGFLFVSGQPGIDPATGEAAGPTLQAQARQAFENLRRVLEAGGSGLDRVVNTTVLVADISGFGEVNALFEEYFASSPPARMTMQIPLPKGLLFSIGCVALAEPGMAIPEYAEFRASLPDRDREVLDELVHKVGDFTLKRGVVPGGDELAGWLRQASSGGLVAAEAKALAAYAMAGIASLPGPRLRAEMKGWLHERGTEEVQMSFNLQYLQLQNAMQNDNRQFTMVSNIMKTKHDTVKNTISNIH